MACKSKSFFLIKPHAFALGFGFYLFQVYFFGRILFCFHVLKQQDSRRHTETLKEEKNKQTTKQTSRSQTECRFPSFSIYQNVHFLHYLVMNEKLLWCNSRCAFVCFKSSLSSCRHGIYRALAAQPCSRSRELFIVL